MRVDPTLPPSSAYAALAAGLLPGLLAAGLASANGVAGLLIGSLVMCWSALATVALLWPLRRLRTLLSLQALAVALPCMAATLAGSAGATTAIGAFAALSALGLSRPAGAETRVWLRLLAGAFLLLSCLRGLGGFGHPPGIDDSTQAFVLLLATAASVLGAGLLRIGLLGRIGASEGGRLALAITLAAGAAALVEHVLPGLDTAPAAPWEAALMLVAALAVALRGDSATAAAGVRRGGIAALWVLAAALVGSASAALDSLDDPTASPILSPGAWLALLWASLGAAILPMAGRRLLWQSLVWICGLLLILSAVVGLRGLLLDAGLGGSWAEALALEPLAALARFSLGCALLLYCERSRSGAGTAAVLIPLAVGAAALLLGIAGWKHLLPSNSDRLQAASDGVGRLLQSRLQEGLDQLRETLPELAARLAEPASGPEILPPGVVAVARPEARAWEPRDARSAELLQRNSGLLQQRLLEIGEHGALDSAPPLAAPAPPWVLVSLSAGAPGRRVRLLLDMEQLLQPWMPTADFGYVAELHAGTVQLLSQPRQAARGAAWRELPLQGLGGRWQLRVAPLPQTAQRLGTQLPLVVLGLGLLLAVTVVAGLRLAVLARRRAAHAESIARGLRREIAAREATESALDRSLDEIGLILATISDGFVFVDRELRVSFANTQAASLLGYANELPVGAELSELWPGLLDEGVGARLRGAIEERSSLQLDALQPRADRWLELRAFPHPNGLALLLRDISEARERSRRLALSEAALRDAQRLARVGGWRFDLASGQWLWSDQLYRILGLSPGQLPPSKDLLLQHVPGEQRTQLAAAFDALLSEGRGFELEHALVLSSGQHIDALSLAQAELGPGRSVQAITGTLQDISLQRRQAAALGAALERSERQARQLQALNRVAVLATRKLGDPDLVPTLLAEIRAAFDAGLVLLLPSRSSGDLADRVHAETDRGPAEACGFDAAAQDFLRRLGASGPLRLDPTTLLAEAAYVELRPEVLSMPLSGLLSVPLHQSGGSRLGYLMVSQPPPGGFSEDDLEVLTQFGQTLAISLDWARLIDMLQATQCDLQMQVAELSRSRALLAGAERVAGLGTWQLRFGEDGRIEGFEASEQTRRILGLGRRQLDTDLVRDRLHPDERVELRALLGRVLNEDAGVDLDHRVLHPDGRTLWVHTQAELSRDSEGRPTHLLGTMQDISRQRAIREMELQHTDLLRGIATGRPLRATLEALIAGFEQHHPGRVAAVFAADDRGGLRDLVAPSLPERFRDRALQLSREGGTGPSRMAAEQRRQIVVEDLRSSAEFAALRELFETIGVRAACATPVLSADDSLLGSFTVYHREPHRPDEDELEAINATVSLVTIAIKTAVAQRRIEEGRQRLRSLFTLVPDAVYALDPEGRIEDCNAAAERTSGRARSLLVGRPLAAVMEPERAQSIHEQVRLAAQGDIQRLEHGGRRADGGRYDAVTTTLPIMVDGNAVGVFLIETDVTEQRRAQEALQVALSDLQARNQELQDFAFVASHDLQEPLRKVQAFGDRLRLHLGEGLDADAADYIQRMRSAAARMQTLINDLLAYSRVSRRAHEPRSIDLGAVLQEVLGDLESRIEASAAVVEVDPLPHIHADPTQMRQLLQNLIGNALKFAAPGRAPRVAVRAEVLGGKRGTGRLRLRVEDNGIGFDSRHAERIFAPFQRLHGRSEYEGSGIGLAIVRKIVERHGGSIQAHGVPGTGACFEIELPLKAEPALSSNPRVCEDSGP
jgi:PAS domain S-box-containing protein